MAIGKPWGTKKTERIKALAIEEYKQELLHQARRVRNYSAPDDVYMAVPVRFIEITYETAK